MRTARDTDTFEAPSGATCSRCGKLIAYKEKDGVERLFAGALIQATLSERETLGFYNFYVNQFGKYLSPSGDVSFMFCFECFLDALFGSLNPYMQYTTRTGMSIPWIRNWGNNRMLNQN